jgi:hypothetical protein
MDESPVIHLMVPFLGFIGVEELDPTFVPLGPAFPFEHAYTHPHAGILELATLISCQIVFAADAGDKANRRTQLKDLVSILQRNYLATRPSGQEGLVRDTAKVLTGWWRREYNEFRPHPVKGCRHL